MCFIFSASIAARFLVVFFFKKFFLSRTPTRAHMCSRTCASFFFYFFFVVLFFCVFFCVCVCVFLIFPIISNSV